MKEFPSRSRAAIAGSYVCSAGWSPGAGTEQRWGSEGLGTHRSISTTLTPTRNNHNTPPAPPGVGVQRV
ncbi:unnamed protein product [Lota lota]